MTAAQIRALHLREQLRYEIYFRNRIYQALRASKRRALGYLRETRDPVALLGFGTSLLNAEPVRTVLMQLYRVTASQQAEDEYRRWFPRQKSIGFGITRGWVEMIDKWFGGFVTNLTNDIMATTWKNITDTISRGLQNGNSYDDIIRDLEATGLDKMRAARIARTESNKGMNAGKEMAIERLPFAVQKEWIAGRDNRTRGVDGKGKADHYHMMGQRVDKGGLFTDPRSGAKMLHPGDTNNGAGPGDVINCRCAMRTIRVR